jgi:hypothetical protein
MISQSGDLKIIINALKDIYSWLLSETNAVVGGRHTIKNTLRSYFFLWISIGLLLLCILYIFQFADASSALYLLLLSIVLSVVVLYQLYRFFSFFNNGGSIKSKSDNDNDWMIVEMWWKLDTDDDLIS